MPWAVDLTRPAGWEQIRRAGWEKSRRRKGLQQVARGRKKRKNPRGKTLKTAFFPWILRIPGWAI